VKIDKLEDAERPPGMFRKGLDTLKAVFADDDDLARLDFPDELGVDLIEGAPFTREDPGVAQPAERERPKAVRIADADEFLFGHEHERIGAFDAADGLDERVFLAARVGWAMRWRMISLSTVVWKIEPLLSSSSRSTEALVRLPL
jgi:hypothetical protein